MEILYYPKFEKQFKKLNRELKMLAIEKEEIFRVNPFDNRLKTHKLKGSLEGLYAFSVNYSYRVVFDYTKRILLDFMK